MNRYLPYVLGPELVWGLLYGFALIMATRNQPATPAGNHLLESVSLYLSFLGVALVFVPLFWATDSFSWWYVRIGVSGFIGVVLVNLVLIGAVHYGDSRDSGIGSSLFFVIPFSWFLILAGIGIAILFRTLKWSFLPLLKWVLICVEVIIFLLWLSGRKTSRENSATPTSNHQSAND